MKECTQSIQKLKYYYKWNQENKRLENEVQSLNQKNVELQKAYMDLHKEAEETNILKKKVNISSFFKDYTKRIFILNK